VLLAPQAYDRPDRLEYTVLFDGTPQRPLGRYLFAEVADPGPQTPLAPPPGSPGPIRPAVKRALAEGPGTVLEVIDRLPGYNADSVRYALGRLVQTGRVVAVGRDDDGRAVYVLV
jgi:hypothetical protein